jgi:hypothetical protein
MTSVRHGGPEGFSSPVHRKDTPQGVRRSSQIQKKIIHSASSENRGSLMNFGNVDNGSLFKPAAPGKQPIRNDIIILFKKNLAKKRQIILLF